MDTATPTGEVFTFHHADLGPLTGLVSPDKVVQFRGIPYATVPGRFKQSILVESLSHTTRNFTKFSYASPQTFSDDSVGGGPFPGTAYPPLSHEFECLNLQLNIPLACLESDSRLSKLPVLVYIHGGGFVLGKVDQEHNTALMVEQSLLDSQPVVSASIQYRLGALGYLHTPEAEHANRALHDQRNALLWIHKYIDGFGGDAKRVTAFGESAGSMSICAHMLSHLPPLGPLFNRVILMSGTLGPMYEPISAKEAEGVYEKFLTTLGIVERGEPALSRLREIDVQAIVDATTALNDAGTWWLPVRDNGFFTDEAQNSTWDTLPALITKCKWVDAIIIGTTGFEGTTQVSRLASVKPDAFLESIAAKTGEKSAETVGKAYGITPRMDQSLFLTQAMRWAGDVIFDAPTHAWAQRLSTTPDKKTYRYIFDVRNPFPNQPYYQQAHHWVDVYFVFKTFQFRFPSQTLKRLSTKHAQLWIDFANGNAPWSEYAYTGNGDEKIMVADEREGWVERTVGQHEGITETSWSRCEALWESWSGESGKAILPMKIACLDGENGS